MDRAKKKSSALVIAIALAIPAEGLRTKAYKDPVGIPTICFGSTKGVKMGDTATVAQCNELLTEEMRERVDAVDACIPNAPPHVLAAFADTAFNVGLHVACSKSDSTAARYLAAGQWTQACNELPKWNKARVAGVLVPLPGLTKRRAAAQEVCLKWST